MVNFLLFAAKYDFWSMWWARGRNCSSPWWCRFQLCSFGCETGSPPVASWGNSGGIFLVNMNIKSATLYSSDSLMRDFFFSKKKKEKRKFPLTSSNLFRIVCSSQKGFMWLKLSIKKDVFAICSFCLFLNTGSIMTFIWRKYIKALCSFIDFSF